MKKITALFFSVFIAFSGVLCTFAESNSSEGKTLFNIASEQVSHNEHLSFEGKFFEAGITSDLYSVTFVSVPRYSSMTITSLAEGKKMYDDHKKLAEGSMETVYALSSLDGSLSCCISGQVTDGEYVASILGDSSSADKLIQLLGQSAEQEVNGKKVTVNNVYFLAPDSSSLFMICESENGLTARAFNKDKYYAFTEEEYAKAYADYVEYRRRVSAENGGQEVVGGKNLFDVHEMVLSGEFDPNSLYVSPVAQMILTVGSIVVAFGATVALILILRRRKHKSAAPPEATE